MPKNVVAVTPGGDITDEMLAGEYLWYSVPDEMVPLAKVRKAFKDAGLDVERLPKARRPEHVFQEACRRVERREQGTAGEPTIEIKAEQVVWTAKEIVYQITRHVWDTENRLIDHPPALRVVFKKADLALGFDRLDNGTWPGVDNVERAIRSEFEKNSTKMPGHKLRTILRHYIETVGAENMRGNAGAVYYMPKVNVQKDGTVIDGRAFVGQILDMLRLVYGRVDAHRVPCVNDEGQRAYLEQKFVENCSEDVEAFRDRALELVATKDKRARGFRRDVIENMIAQRENLYARRSKWEQILGRELASLSEDMTLADKALESLLGAAEHEAVAA